MNEMKDEKEKRKIAIFETMSVKRQNFILKKGFEKWNPFIEPKDPIDIRRDKSQRTSQMLVREFLHTKVFEGYSNAFARGVLEMAIGIINDDDRFLGMYEFAQWHKELLNKEK